MSTVRSHERRRIGPRGMILTAVVGIFVFLGLAALMSWALYSDVSARNGAWKVSMIMNISAVAMDLFARETSSWLD